MNSAVWSAIAVAACAVLGTIGAVLALAFRVGRLVGTVEAANRSAIDDRQRLWQELGRANGRIERHLEISHGGAPHRPNGR